MSSAGLGRQVALADAVRKSSRVAATCAEMLFLQQRLLDKEGATENKEYIPRLAQHIVSIDGERTLGPAAMGFVEKLYGPDTLALRDAIDDHVCGIDTRLQLECECGSSIETFLPMSPEFFRPRRR